MNAAEVRKIEERAEFLEKELETLKARGKESSLGAIALYLELGEAYILLGNDSKALERLSDAKRIASENLGGDSLEAIRASDRILLLTQGAGAVSGLDENHELLKTIGSDEAMSELFINRCLRNAIFDESGALRG